MEKDITQFQSNLPEVPVINFEGPEVVGPVEIREFIVTAVNFFEENGESTEKLSKFIGLNIHNMAQALISGQLEGKTFKQVLKKIIELDPSNEKNLTFDALLNLSEINLPRKKANSGRQEMKDGSLFDRVLELIPDYFLLKFDKEWLLEVCSPQVAAACIRDIASLCSRYKDPKSFYELDLVISMIFERDEYEIDGPFSDSVAQNLEKDGRVPRYVLGAVKELAEGHCQSDYAKNLLRHFDPEYSLKLKEDDHDNYD